MANETTTAAPFVSVPSPWDADRSYLCVLLADGIHYSAPINPGSSRFDFPEGQRGEWHDTAIDACYATADEAGPCGSDVFGCAAPVRRVPFSGWRCLPA